MTSQRARASRIPAGRVLELALTLAAALAACSPGPSGSPATSPSTNPGPSAGGSLGDPEIRLLLIERFGPLWYCDPDVYPVGRDEVASMRERWPEVLADAELLSAVLQALHLPPLVQANLNDEQRLAVYRLWKVTSAITLETIGNGRYRFDYLAQPAEGAPQGTRTAGIIDDTGRITIEVQAPATEPVCPICLTAGTLIETPTGAVPVERLRLGDPIWTVDLDGRRILGTVIALGSTQAPAGHHVVRLGLADGRAVSASPGHPLADGRRLAEIEVGDLVDGSAVVLRELLAYEGRTTFDIVASGPTGTYLAGGIPLATTLR